MGIVADMPPLIFDPQPGVIEELIEQRARLGLDRRDEVWEGVPLIIDPHKRSVEWSELADGEHRPLERGTLIDLGPAELAGQIDWPA